MKFVLVAVLLMSFNVMADHHEESFEEAKAHAISMTDKRIESLNAAKGCISAATDKAGLNKCREEMKKTKGDMRKESKTRRQNLRDQRRSKKAQ